MLAAGALAWLLALCPPAHHKLSPQLAMHLAPQDEESGALKALRPIGAAEFVLLPRQLPPIKDLEVRVDSSLRGTAKVRLLPKGRVCWVYGHCTWRQASLHDCFHCRLRPEGALDIHESLSEHEETAHATVIPPAGVVLDHRSVVAMHPHQRSSAYILPGAGRGAGSEA